MHNRHANFPSEFLPGKRALAIGLCVYHVTVSTIMYNAPRVIPYSFGALAESYVVPSSVILRLLICFVDVQVQDYPGERLGHLARPYRVRLCHLVASYGPACRCYAQPNA